MNKREFDTLIYCKNNVYVQQRKLSEYLVVSLGTANSIVKNCRNNMWLSKSNELTEEGYRALEEYKVDNAIIMAAGMSSRFAPLSYEMPKGLLKVKGEILIERQIKQLQEVGIEDITVVVGYMMEKFLYLKDKFGVKIRVNEDYYRYNNTSTLIRVIDKLNNTYICSSDNYFTENVFEKYVYDSYYSAVKIPGKTDEWGMNTDKSGRIVSINHFPEDMYCMLGHVYFSNNFSEKFKKLLKEQYSLLDIKNNLWEYFLEKNLRELPIFIRKYDSSIIKEFDSLDELRSFDERYLENTDSRIFKNICKVLECKESEIKDIEVVSQGLTNLSFSFFVRNTKYIYRHPGVGTEKYISRKSEAFSTEIAKKLGLDRTIIYISGDEGWKLSYFVNDNHTLDYHNKEEVKTAISMIKKLHNAQIESDYDFNIWQVTINLINQLSDNSKRFSDFEELYNEMSDLFDFTEKDNVKKILCHCDCYDPNFLIDKNGAMTLIDWEYSGNDDPCSDLGTFICCSDYTYKESLEIFDIYFGRKPTKTELRHCLAYVAIASYYWFIWAIYQESIGKIIGEYLVLWYNNTKLYLNKSLELYKEELDNV